MTNCHSTPRNDTDIVRPGTVFLNRVTLRANCELLNARVAGCARGFDIATPVKINRLETPF
jgi:hypothetical protein